MSSLNPPENTRRLLSWADSSEVEDSSWSDAGTSERSLLGTTVPIQREDRNTAMAQRTRRNINAMRKDLESKERAYIRLRNKYNSSKRREQQLQEDWERYSREKLDLQSEVEFLRLQLADKERQLSLKHYENIGHGEKHLQDSHTRLLKDITGDLESSFINDFWLAKIFLSVHVETRQWFSYILLSLCLCLSAIAFATRSTILYTVLLGLWSLMIASVCLEVKQLFKTLKLKYLRMISEVSRQNLRLGEETSRLVSRLRDVQDELTNEKKERVDMETQVAVTEKRLTDEISKKNELVQLEKSTHEELLSERVRRRRAEEHLEEVSALTSQAQERDVGGERGDACQELRDNLQYERESSEKLRRENERLIKEIVEMNMTEEKRLMKEGNDQLDVIDERKTDLLESGKASSELKALVDKISQCDGATQVSENDKKTVGALEYVADKNEDVLNESQDRNEDEFSPEDEKVLPPGNDRISTRDCWIFSWNIPNETNLALFFIIVSCLALAVKVVLSNTFYVFVMFIAALGSFYILSSGKKY